VHGRTHGLSNKGPCFAKWVLAAALYAVLMPAEARSLDEIIRTHTFDLCAVRENMPFSADESPARGALVDLGAAVAQRLGVESKISWLFSAEYARKTDCDAIPAVAAIPDDDPLRLTIPYLKVRTVLVVRSGHRAVASVDDLRSDTVAVLAESWARHLLNMAHLNLKVAFLQSGEILAAVANGDVDAGVVTLPYFEWYHHEHPESDLRAEDRYVIDPSLDYVAAFGLRHADIETVKTFNQILTALIADGSISRIFALYGMRYEPPS
jgi:polar amino acid transport system substrate-binding protein